MAIPSRPVAGRWISVGCAIFAGLVGSAALGLAAASVWPQSPLAGWLSRRLPLGEVHAERALYQAQSARGPSDPALRAAESETRLEMASTPLRPAPLVRLAYIEQMKAGGRWTPAVADALARSYAIAPYDREVGIARTRLLFDHWSEIEPSWRARALDEHAVLWNHAGLKPQLRASAASVIDGAGRLASALHISKLERADSVTLAHRRQAP